jgi:hypothetical protein
MEVAELILTDEEKAAALWSDLDDAALGKLVKRKIALITDVAAQLDQVTTFSAAVMLCLAAHEANAKEAVFEIDGLARGELEIGDWRVVAMRITPSNALGQATGAAVCARSPGPEGSASLVAEDE